MAMTEINFSRDITPDVRRFQLDADNAKATQVNIPDWAKKVTINAETKNGVRIAFTTDSDTGLFQTSNGQIGFAVDGGEIGAVTTSGLRLGTGTATAQLHLFSSSLTNEQLIVENTEAGATEGPNIVLFRNSASPADNARRSLCVAHRRVTHR